MSPTACDAGNQRPRRSADNALTSPILITAKVPMAAITVSKIAKATKNLAEIPIRNNVCLPSASDLVRLFRPASVRILCSAI